MARRRSEAKQRSNGQPVELWRGTLLRSPYPALSYRVEATDRQIVLRLTATRPLPKGARAQRPLLHERLIPQLFADLFERTEVLLAECLRPASGARP